MITKQCFNCVHFWLGVPAKCAAFPDGIPIQILKGEFDHTKKHPAQENEVVFEAEERGAGKG